MPNKKKRVHTALASGRNRAYIALLTNAVIWGSAFPIIKPALSMITPIQYLFLRFFVAGLCGLPLFIYYYIRKHPKTSYTIKVLLIEVVQLLSLPLLYTGLAKTGALEASLLGATGPVFVVLGSMWFLRERESIREWQGLALSLLGSLIIVAEPLLSVSTSDTPTSTVGNLYVIGYNIAYTVYVLTAKKMYKTRPPVFMGPLVYLLAAALYAVILSFSGSFPNLAILTNTTVLIPVLYMALPGGILAFALYLYAQSKIEVSEANLFTYLNGVFAIPAAYVFLGEKPSLVTLIAITVIAAGVYRAEVKKR